MEIEAPVVGTELDTDDIPGSTVNLVTGVAGVSLMFGIVAAGRAIYNRLSQETDAVKEVELL